MEIVQIIRTGEGDSKGIREFKSGMVGIAKGQTVRISAVNTGLPSDEEKVDPNICFGLWSNPSSELLAQTKIALKPGGSGFLDVDFDKITGHDTIRHQVRAVVTVANDPRSNCQVTLEVFDKISGKTAVFTEIRESSAWPLVKTT
jgi:hypothetical protein